MDLKQQRRKRGWAERGGVETTWRSGGTHNENGDNVAVKVAMAASLEEEKEHKKKASNKNNSNNKIERSVYRLLLFVKGPRAVVFVC